MEIPFKTIHEAIECPTLHVTGTTEKIGQDVFAVFTAKLGTTDLENIAYKWTSETEATEIWLSFDANQKPVPNPTVGKSSAAPKKTVRRKSK